jgi:bacterioferritin
MKGNKEVIKGLNAILTNELTAVNEYFLHGRMLGNWGITALAEKLREESLGEMKHADMLIERILFLDGLPNVQDMHKIKIGETVPEIFTCDLAIETKNQQDLKREIAVCEKHGDYASRALLTTILTETEEHVDWLETQLQLIKLTGLENYIALQSGKAG